MWLFYNGVDIFPLSATEIFYSCHRRLSNTLLGLGWVMIAINCFIHLWYIKRLNNARISVVKLSSSEFEVNDIVEPTFFQRKGIRRFFFFLVILLNCELVQLITTDFFFMLQMCKKNDKERSFKRVSSEKGTPSVYRPLSEHLNLWPEPFQTSWSLRHMPGVFLSYISHGSGRNSFSSTPRCISDFWAVLY